MRILYFGGQKSGKSKLAEQKALELSSQRAIYKKPIYVATYYNAYNDTEMQERINQHLTQRKDKFQSIEEPIKLNAIVKEQESYLIDCISMWILNTLDKPLEMLLDELEALAQKDSNIIFVLNDVNSGIIPLDKESRTFVDRTGIIGQKLASFCDEVYEVKLGLTLRIK